MIGFAYGQEGKTMDTDSVGIAGLGSYLPEKIVDAWEAVKESGISKEKFSRIGAAELHLAAEGEMPSSMAVDASRQALDNAGLTPDDVDLIIYTGSVKDHSRWQASNKVQADLEAFNSYVFDLYQGSSGQNMALSVAHSMIIDDPDLETVLIAAGERWDTTLERPILGHSFIFGDGGSAAVLRRGHPEHVLLAWAHATKGEHHAAFCVPDVGAGTKLTPEVFARGGHMFQFCKSKDRSPDEIRAFIEEFNQTGKQTFELAARRAQVAVGDIDFVVMLNSSAQHNRYFLGELGFGEDQSTLGYIAETGLLGTADIFYNLQRALSDNRVKKGDLVAFYTVGGGYSWTVTLVRA